MFWDWWEFFKKRLREKDRLKTANTFSFIRTIIRVVHDPPRPEEPPET